jgi:hypothetical protein
MADGTSCKEHAASRVAVCAVCAEPLCEVCAVFAVGDRGSACKACGEGLIRQAPANGALTLLLVALGYLGIVALGTLVAKASSAAVGVAALGAVFLSRVLPLRPGLGRPDLRLRRRG